MTKFLVLFLSICILACIYHILKSKSKEFKSNLKLFFIIIIVIWIVSILIIYPSNTVEAAYKGLYTWFNIVFPSLLPFFIFSEILVGLGIVKFIGTLLEPLMQPLFNVPGEGSFAFTMSVTSGYPVGAKLISNLRMKNSITQYEAHRLLSFCSTSGPLFMIGAVSIGMFHNPKIGPLIAISHYSSAILVGLFFRFYGPKRRKPAHSYHKYTLKEAFNNMIKARKSDGRSLGNLLSDSVREAVQTMLNIGGFIILYSVIIEVLTLSNVFVFASESTTYFFPNFNQPDFIKGILSGIFEMTNGCKLLSEMTYNNLPLTLSSVSFLIGWSGLSIHSQTLSFINKTDIRINLYIFTKFLHGIFSSILTFFLYHLYFIRIIEPTIFYHKDSMPVQSPFYLWMSNLSFSFKLGATLVAVLFIMSIFIGILGYKFGSQQR